MGLVKLLLIFFIFPAMAEDNSTRVQVENLFGERISSIKFDGFRGRVNTDNDQKSYLILTVGEEVHLVPMATSRYDTSYHDQEWLDKRGLTTNPDTFILNKDQDPKTQSLSEYLLKYHFVSKNGFIELFRGYSSPAEMSSWEKGIPARGARYWTPDPTYAWRYARRDKEFLAQTLNDSPPILKFRVPVDVFNQAVRDNHFILGIELPASVHKRIDRDLGFTDHLFGGQSYMGAPSLGADLELRIPGNKRHLIANYYQGQISSEDLLNHRRHQVNTIYSKVIESKSNEKDNNDKLIVEKNNRLKNIDAEIGMTKSFSGEGFSSHKNNWSSPGEIFNNDFASPDFHQKKSGTRSSCQVIIGEES